MTNSGCMVFGMNGDYELFRGAGAMAALEAATIRAVLDEAGIPHQGGRMRVLVAAGDRVRAGKLVREAFAEAAKVEEMKVRGAGKTSRNVQRGGVCGADAPVTFQRD